ncbi:DNA-binding protein BIN4 isoform X2 [Cajanus cajan]|uniref:DNA-binding protein BIN4 isoform X2 n=1 Tax=Cajanus cajan TaxID=3821 RepID=UPI00098DD48A|nr:DNA-binding protein BIN4 isoform X2 [Cajanus cajan]
MSSSRESSPDWLRSFQVPTHSPLTLSSDSGSLNEDKTDDEGSSPISSSFLKVTRSKRKTTEPTSPKVEDQTPSKRKKLDKQKAEDGNGEEKKTGNESNIGKHKESIHSIWTLSSDSESFHDQSPKREDHIDQVETSHHQISGEGEGGDGLVIGNDGKSPSKKGSKEKSSQKQKNVEGTPIKEKKIKASAKGKGSGDVKAEEEETCEKLAEPNVSSVRFPLMLSDKVHRTKALIECQGDSIDLSGDMGAVGRIIISDSPSGDQEMYLDLKGTIYKTSIVPCRTFCVVSFGQSEAKIEAIMNDFIQLKPQSNVYEAETMVEGTLDGFFFDSDEEAGKMQKSTHQADQSEHVEEQTNGKSKGKADKTSKTWMQGAEKKRGRSTGGKPQAKIAKKKTPGSKRAKTKK